MVDLTLDSSIDAAVNVFGPNKNILVRVFWIFLFALSFFGLFHYIHGSYTKWLLDPDIITKTRIRRSEEFPPFAFTICPLQFDMKAMLKIREKVEKDANSSLSEKECSVIGSFGKWCYTKGDYFNPILEIGSKNLREDYCLNEKDNSSNPHNWSEVYSTLFEGYGKFNLTNLKTSSKNILTTHGACTTFNMLNQSIFKENWMNEAYQLMTDGDESSWTADSDIYHQNDSILKLNVDYHAHILFHSSSNESCSKLEDPNSFRLILHQPDEIGTLFHESYKFKYGMHTSMSIVIKSQRSSKELRILDPDVRGCYFEEEKKLKNFKRYSKHYCMLECLTNVKTSYSDPCDALEIPRKNKSDKGFCFFDDAYFFERNPHATDECKCYPSCNFLQYEVLDTRIVTRKINTSTFSLLVDVFAGSVEETEKFMTYTLANFVADIGGYLGLFLGCSILSIVELFFFVAAKLFHLFKMLIKKQSSRSSSSSNSGIVSKEMFEDMRKILFDLAAKVERLEKEQKEFRSSLQEKVSTSQQLKDSKSTPNLKVQHQKSKLDVELLEMIKEN